MNGSEFGDLTDPITQLTPRDLVAGEISLRPWPVRMGPLEFDRLRDLEDQRRRLDEEWSRLDEVREQARDEGLRQGRKEALEQNGRRFSAQLRHHDAELDRLKQGLLTRLPGLAARLAARMLGRELTSSPEIFSDWVMRLLGELMPAEEITLIHHPDDAGRLAGIVQRAGSTFGHVRFQLRGDDRLAPGEVILETPGLRTDARCPALAAVLERELEQVPNESVPG